ncbi:DNA-binding NarL/FixJ family response regulator [Flavobacterium sp. CG_9.1]|uniref:response regulator n=1 Tax=Flavobacterium sp. CG_9.1 TaxID=2787728 RepID=UPI0018CB9B93|nr:response regulator transcription factor [Flavobacterium sp. CG_9.1]MBG6060681.1 DNA-binding NarL/FixJ family response regulator [Flavobacterium sp. CG_9.1]
MPIINLFFVDDHPIIIDGYSNILSTTKTNDTTISITAAYSCEQAYFKIIESHQAQKYFDLAFVDISLPTYPAQNLYTGIDVAKLIRYYFPACNIVVLTMHSEPAIITAALQEINPEGFILKNAINAASLVAAYQAIMMGATFYSSTITKVQKENAIKRLNLDAIDCQILTLLDKKIKMKDMPNHIDLSLSAIEKRKTNIKNRLLKDKGNDAAIVTAAKKLGLLLVY